MKLHIHAVRIPVNVVAASVTESAQFGILECLWATDMSLIDNEVRYVTALQVDDIRALCVFEVTELPDEDS